MPTGHAASVGRRRRQPERRGQRPVQRPHEGDPLAVRAHEVLRVIIMLEAVGRLKIWDWDGWVGVSLLRRLHRGVHELAA